MKMSLKALLLLVLVLAYFGLETQACEDPKALGMESEKIKDVQITASTEWSSNHGASNARLNFRKYSGSWSSKLNDLNQWLQVDFKYKATITDVLTQGRGRYHQWVESYTLSYSDDGINFKPYQMSDKNKIFLSNNDQHSITTNALNPVIKTRYVRIHPKSWNNHISMRVDFRGCFEGQPCASEPCLHEGKCNQTGEKFTCSCRAQYYGDRCEHHKVCMNPTSLGMERGTIPDSRITASTAWDRNHCASNARLNFEQNSGSWSSKPNNLNQWLQVDFKYNATVIDILTQGRGRYHQWVRSYTVSYSDDGVNFKPYQRNGKDKTFVSNIDQHSIVRNVLDPVIVARFVRIHPKTWNNHISMRVEFNGCFQGQPCSREPCLHEGICKKLNEENFTCSCLEGYYGVKCEKKVCTDPKALGMESGKIPHSQITASTEWDSLHGARNARLNFVKLSGSWSSKHNDLNQWLQVDFRYRVTVTDISTQGRGRYYQWVESYSVSYSDDGVNFKTYQSGGKDKVFIANVDQYSIVENALDPVIVARFVRIHPKTWFRHISMRVEFKGCFSGQPCASEPCLHEGKCNEIGEEFTCLCREGYFGDRCNHHQVCKNPISLGMESEKITNSQITASTEWDPNHGASNARLNFEQNSGSWSSKPNNLNQWLQIDFKYNATIIDILTQGRGRYHQWVRSYTVSYSNDGVKFTPYQKSGKDKIFVSNIDQYGIVTNALDPVINARFVRIHPKSWNNHISMRVEFNGCFIGQPCARKPCLHRGECNHLSEEKFTCSCLEGYYGHTCEQKVCTDSKALGMEAGKIPDAQITSSTEWDPDHGASNARLNFAKLSGSWSSKTNDLHQWLQVDFNYRAMIANILTQGRGRYYQWVRSFSVTYSDDGVNFKPYQRDGEDQVFISNTDQHSVVTNSLDPVIAARFIRIHPKSWTNHISMRVEFNGCFNGQPCESNPCLNEGKCSQNGEKYTCSCRAGYYGSRCEEKECKQPLRLGEENGEMLKISASTEWDDNHAAENARLNFHALGKRQGAWSAKYNNLNQWLQVNFQRQATVTEIMTQGRSNADEWVRSYTVTYSNDGVSFFEFLEKGLVKVFEGNSDRNTIVRQKVSPVIVAKYIRIHPLGLYGHISMRVGFSGCLKESKCESPPCMNGGTCLEYRGGYLCACPESWAGQNCTQNIEECLPKVQV